MFVCMLCLLVLCALFALFFTNDDTMISHEGGEGVQGRRRKGELEGTGEQGTERVKARRGARGCGRRAQCTGEGVQGIARAKRGAQGRSEERESKCEEGDEGTDDEESARMR